MEAEVALIELDNVKYIVQKLKFLQKTALFLFEILTCGILPDNCNSSQMSWNQKNTF